MTMTLEENGLKLDKEKSYTITGLDFSKKDDSFFVQIKEYISEGSYFIAYLDYAVIIGTYKNQEFNFVVEDGKGENGKVIYKPSSSFETKFIQKLRIFNQSKELYIWRTTQNEERIFKARLREDNSNHSESKEIEYVQANQILFGTTSEPITLRQAQDDMINFTKLTEDRGTEVILPFTNINIDDKDKRIAIRTRNYIGYNEIGQAGYVDCRFVCFVKMPEGKELE